MDDLINRLHETSGTGDPTLQNEAASRIVFLEGQAASLAVALDTLLDLLEGISEAQREAVSVVNKQGAAFPAKLAQLCEQARLIIPTLRPLPILKG